jgi:hypothetical protein
LACFAGWTEGAGIELFEELKEEQFGVLEVPIETDEKRSK